MSKNQYYEAGYKFGFELGPSPRLARLIGRDPGSVALDRMNVSGMITEIIGSYNDADEIVSDVFFTVWKNRKKLLEVDNILLYLFKISKFKSIDRLRVKKIPLRTYGSIDVDLFANVTTSPEDKCISTETIHEIDMAIEQLPPKCKLAFKLVREDKMSHKEAAELLDISIKTLQNHLCLALQKIKSVLMAKGISCN